MSQYTKGFLITLAGVLVITPDTLLIRLIDADSWTLLFWRGALSAVGIAVGVFATQGVRAFGAFRTIGLPGLSIAVIFSLGTTCFVISVNTTLVANTLFITATSPVFAALISRFVLKEAVSRRTWMTILATMAGIAIIASGSLGAGQGNVWGDLAAVGAAVSTAATFSIARAKKSASMVPAMSVAGVCVALIALCFTTTVAVPAQDVAWMAILGLVVAAGGFALLATGPRYLPAPDVSLLLLLEAILGPLLVWALLGEFPGERTLIGGAVVLVAMVASNLIALRSAGARPS